MPDALHMSGIATRVVQTAASRAVRLALAAVTTVLIARTLQPEGRGVYAMITTTATIAIVAGHLSIWKSQIALWPNPARRRFLTGNSLILSLILGVTSALGALVIVLTFVPQREPVLLVIVLLVVPFGVVSINLNGIALLQSQTGLANRAVVVSALVLSLPPLVLAATGTLTLTAAAVSWAISTTVPFLLFMRPLGLVGARGDAALARHQLSLSGRYHIGMVSQHLLLTADVFLLNALVSPAEVGLYAAAGSILAIAWVPTDAVTQVSLHRQAVENEHDAREATVRALRLNLMLSSTLVTTLAIASPTLIPLVYGSAYIGSVGPLLLMVPAAVALSLIRPTEQYLVRLGRPLTMAALPLSGLAVNLALNSVLIPGWGAAGAGLAASVSYLTVAAAEVTWFARVSGTGLRELRPRISDLRSAASLVAGVGRRRPG